jgi:hypothetical protein
MEVEDVENVVAAVVEIVVVEIVVEEIVDVVECSF